MSCGGSGWGASGHRPADVGGDALWVEAVGVSHNVMTAGGAAAERPCPEGPGGARASGFAAALGGVVGPGGTLKSAAASQTKSIMAELNNYARFQPKSKSTRMKLGLVAPPPPVAPPISTTFGDVEILLMGPGNIAQIELTFHKD